MQHESVSISPESVKTTRTTDLSERLLKNSFWNFAAYAVFALVAFFSAKLYIEFLGVRRYGLMVLLTSILAPLGFLNFGLGKATVKYVADSLARNRRDEVERYLGNTLFFNIAVGALGGFIMVLLAPWLTKDILKIAVEDQHLAVTASYWMAASWALSQISATFVAVPTAMQRFNLVSVGSTFFSIGSVVVSIGVLFYGQGLLAVMQIRFIWEIITILGWTLVTMWLLPGTNLFPAYHREEFRKCWQFGVWQTVATVGGLLANQTDRFLLGIFTSTNAVGLFNVPVIVFSGVYSAVAKLAEALFPAISDLQARDDKSRMTSVLLYSSCLLTLLTVASQSVLFFFAADILHLYLGADYSAPLATVLRISALAAVISAPSIVVTQYLLGIGKTKWLATLTIASGLVNLFGGIILVPKWGLQGAAWSDLCAIVLTRPFIHYLIWKRELAGQLAFKTFFSALYGTGAIALPLILLVDVFFQERTHPYELGHLIPLMFGSGALMGAFCVAVGLSFSLQREMYTKSSRRISEIFMKKFRGSIQTR